MKSDGNRSRYPPNLFIEPFGRDAVKRGEVRIEHDALATQDNDPAGNRLDRDQSRFVLLVMPRHRSQPSEYTRVTTADGEKG